MLLLRSVRSSTTRTFSGPRVVATTTASPSRLAAGVVVRRYPPSGAAVAVRRRAITSSTPSFHQLRKNYTYQQCSRRESSSVTSAAATADDKAATERLWAQMTPETRVLADRLSASSMTTATTTTTATDRSSNDEKEQEKESFWKHRLALSRAITLAESKHEVQQEQANLLLTHLLLLKRQQADTSGDNFLRIGIAGSPGAGKSTFLEAFGSYLLENHGHDVPKLAMTCIDPSHFSSSDNNGNNGGGGGSILGDKTRMSKLATDLRAFVRPAPAQNVLGGLAPATYDVCQILSTQCPLVFVETVGLGQSELEIQHVVDLTLLVVPPGGGDDMQAVKKGIVEIADLVLVTKADGDLEQAATRTAAEYRGALQFLDAVRRQERGSSSPAASCRRHNEAPSGGGGHPQTTPVILTSAVTGKGFEKVWQAIQDLKHQRAFDGRRKEQGRHWMWKHLQNAIVQKYMKLGDLDTEELLAKVDCLEIPPRVAALMLLEQLQKAS